MVLKGATVMKLTLGMKVCVWAIAGLLAAGTGWGQSQYGDGSIVGWGKRVVGADLSADFVAVGERRPQSRPEIRRLDRSLGEERLGPMRRAAVEHGLRGDYGGV